MLTYKDSGVDPDKATQILSNFASFLKTRPKDPNILSGIGPFASCFSLKSVINNFEDPVLVTSCDGVGTKVKLGLDWNRIEDLGQDLVAMNVNDVLCVGAQPFLFLDYYACGKLHDAQLTTLLKSIQQGCELAGCSLVGGETAEMPGVYQSEDFDLAGFTVGFVERTKILGAEKVIVGDVLLAIASNGIHSNGYSLVRRIVEKKGILPDDKTPFGNSSWKDLLLAPTRIYVPYLKPLLCKVSALAHLTGGGLFENLPRVLPPNTVAAIDSKSWDFPPLFRWLQEGAELSTQEMLKTFNCGVGMIAVVPRANVAEVKTHLEKHRISTKEIGTIERSDRTTPFVEWR